ncbi:hypothetical protein T06_13084 [Trichinella sp. T6]|nr:hypothetical protein T06_13084 [Trichinella sp. T6]
MKVSTSEKVLNDAGDTHGDGYAPGYALGKIRKISKFLKNSPRLLPQAMPQGK